MSENLENKVSYLNKIEETGTFYPGPDGSSPLITRSYSRWSPKEEGVTLAWSDLSVYAKSSGGKNPVYKKLISGVSGAVKAGTLVALMGSSGAGKSTLMTALAYRNSADTVVEGDILINGRPIGDYMKFLSGFMHQDDIFIGSLTVWEHMNAMARLKLDRRLSYKERRHKILEILKQLGLMKCINTRIGSEGEQKVLSGGEKKRLAFATEMLTDPPILFCDEPTTGLDSYSAQKLVSIMNTMASSGKTIVCTIHQPSSQIFAMFSQIILLAEGNIAFMGSTMNALEFFNQLGYACPYNYNPADFLIRTLAITPGCEDRSKQAIKRICNNFYVSDYAKEVDVVVQYEFHMGRASTHSNFTIRHNFKESLLWTKISWVTYRFFIEILRDPNMQVLRILQKIAIAVMIGLCYYGTNALTQYGVQSLEGAIFLIVTENTFLPMYSTLALFPLDIPLFRREYKSGLYSTGSFYFSKILSMVPGLCIEPIVFVVIVYWLCGLRSTLYAFSMTILCSLLTIHTATACGVFFSNLFDSVNSAMAWLVPIDFILMITSGLFIKLSTLSTVFSITKYASWFMYSTEALTIIQWNGVQNISCIGGNNELPCLRNGLDVIEKFSFRPEHLYWNLCNMVFLIIIFYVLGFLCLYYKTKKA